MGGWSPWNDSLLQVLFQRFDSPHLALSTKTTTQSILGCRMVFFLSKSQNLLANLGRGRWE